MADPLSITTGCLSLISAVAKTTVSVASFIRGCRDARADLTAVNLQLSELRIVLELLHEDHGAAVIPDTLQRQILSIIANCTAVVDKIDDLLERYNVEAGKAIGGAVTSVKWVAFGKAEAAGLRMSLEAHRGSLELALELVSISLAKSTKEDTSAIREGVVDIKLDTTQILEELARLRAIVSGGGMSAAVPGQASVLEKWLDSLTSYAETVVNDVDWSSDGGSIHAVSGRPSLEIPVADQSQEPKDEAAASGHNKPEDLPQAQHLQEQIDSQITALQTPELAETHISVNSILRKPIGPRLSSARAIESNDVKPNPSGEGKSRTDAANTTGPLLNNNEEPQTSSSVAWSAVFDVMSSVTYGTATVDEPIPKETKIELAWEPESPPSNSVVGSQRDLVFNEPPPPVYEETVSKEETSEDERPKQRRTVYDELMEIMARPRELHWAADAQIKVVLVGDGCSGKTTMLNAYSDTDKETDWLTKSWELFLNSWEIYTPVTQVDDQTIQFMLYDTRGQEDYDRARPIYYRKTDVYIITYAIDSPDSLDNVFEKWVPEVQHFAKGAPYVLVGMKKELRVNERTIEDLKRVGQQPVTTAEGLAMSRRIGAAGYFECSNVTREGIHELFEAVGSVALRYRKSRRMSSVWYSISKAFKNMKNQAGSNAP